MGHSLTVSEAPNEPSSKLVRCTGVQRISFNRNTNQLEIQLQVTTMEIHTPVNRGALQRIFSSIRDHDREFQFCPLDDARTQSRTQNSSSSNALFQRPLIHERAAAICLTNSGRTGNINCVNASESSISTNNETIRIPMSADDAGNRCGLNSEVSRILLPFAGATRPDISGFCRESLGLPMPWDEQEAGTDAGVHLSRRPPVCRPELPQDRAMRRERAANQVPITPIEPAGPVTPIGALEEFAPTNDDATR